jgi:glycosyltransferase involved in cell wall biosynthesis
MRIVFYYPRAVVGDGGMTGAVRQLAHGLAASGLDVSMVYAEGDARGRDPIVDWAQVDHVGVWRARVPRKLQAVFEGNDLAIFHSAWVVHNVMAGAVARRAGVPYILAPRGAYDPHIVRRKRLFKLAWWTAFEKKLVHEARAMHLFFESERSDMEALGYSGPWLVAPNGVEPPDDVHWDGGSGGYVLWMGRFDPEHKGLDLLLAGMARMSPSSRPPLRLVGPDWRGRKKGVAALIDRLGLGDSVTVEAPVYGRDKWDLLSAAKGFVYPSRWEGFGNSVAEAVSVGVPTLTTGYPLGRYLAAQGGGFLAETSATGLADGLDRLSSSEAGQVAATGSALVRSAMSWENVTAVWRRQLLELGGAREGVG